MEILLITAAIDIINNNVPYTKITNTQQRLDQYLKSLEFAIANYKNLDVIIFCDNTNYYYNYENLIDNAANHNKILEILSFEGEKNLNSQKGKGYGEGEIIEYAINKSKYLSSNQSFYKMTGRLIIKNFNNLVSPKSCDNLFMYYPKVIYGGNVDYVSTIFYKVSVDFYKKTLLRAYMQVDDNKAIYLEHIFYQQLAASNGKINSFKTYPQISGLSGSSGDTYDLRSIKFYIEKLLTFFGVHRIRQTLLSKTVVRLIARIKI